MMNKKDEKKYNRNERIGNLLYRLGFKYGASTDIADYLSLGYGRLDDNGFWQYPIRTKLFPHIVISFFWQYESIYRSFFAIVKEYRSPYKMERYDLKWREEVQHAKFIFEFPKIRRRDV